MAQKIFRINYKSDFLLTLESDAGWMTPFCIKFFTGAPSRAYYVGWDGTTYMHCSYDPSEPTKLQVQFDDHHLPVGDLKFQIAYHFTVADFPNNTEDEVINPANITTEIDGQEYQVMLDFTGETAPEIQFSLPAYANEVSRIENELQRQENELARQENELARQEAELEREQATAAAVQGAENVNAQLNGTILTVTNRNGVSTSSDVQGPQGETGATPVIDATASVDDNVGIPMVTVESFGPADNRTFDFAFKNLKGEPGNYTKPADGIPLSDLDGNVASGIVYDVTANNSGATFASLSALLSSGSLSTLIPTFVRKGGMQIRFVQSSDNKYVQFRYMSSSTTTADFTNVVNWQGVTNEMPNYDDYKEDIITGRAVLVSQTNKIANGAGKLTDFFIYQNWMSSSGAYLGNSGTYVNYKCVCVPVAPGTIIKISKGATQNAYCAFLKSLLNVDNHSVSSPSADLCSGESRRTITDSTSSPQSLTAPSDAAYLYVGIYNGTDVIPQVFTIDGYDCKKSLKEHVVLIENELSKIDSTLYRHQSLPTAEWKDKSFNSNAGTDGIFFDKRNKISAINKLVKIGVNAKNDGVVKIHYLSTTSPYAEIANESHQVVSGVNEFVPTATLTYEQEMYVAFSNDETSSPGIRIVYPSDGSGQAIKKNISSGVITEQTYPYALWIYTLQNRVDTLEERIDEGEITTLSGLKKALSDNIGFIRLGAASITLDGTLSIPSGTKISGVRGKTVINVPSSVLKGIELSSVNDVVIENVTLAGAYNGTPVKTGLQPVKPGIVDTSEEARLFTNAGYQTDLTNGGVTSTYVPQIGININECEKIEIIGCEIKNFSYYGIANALSGKNYRYACKFENNYINNCYCGIYIYKEAERSQYIANNVSLCQIGLYMDSGTNMFTDCAFSANRIGMFMNNGWNHAHGVQTGNAFTHCSLYSLYAYNVENGEVFSQCKFGYVDNEEGNDNNAIYAKNSRGLFFNNCQMISCNIKFDGKFYLHCTGKTIGTADQFGNTNYVITYEDISGQASQYNGGVSQILGSSYISNGGNITISSDLDATNVVMKNNYFIDGRNSSGLNN